MEDMSNIFDKIRSNMIFKTIFSFMPNQYYKLKLFKNSKKFQSKFGIELKDYKIAHIVKNKSIELKKYFSFKDNFEKVVWKGNNKFCFKGKIYVGSEYYYGLLTFLYLIINYLIYVIFIIKVSE